MTTPKTSFPPTTALLMVAFGAGTPQGQKSLRLFETALRTSFPTLVIRWAFTSSLIRTRLTQEQHKTDSLEKALEKLYFEKYSNVVVQTLHLISGTEYSSTLKHITQLKKRNLFASISINKPLLSSPQGCEAVAKALLKSIPKERASHEPCFFMGHGTKHTANDQYRLLNIAVHKLDPCSYIGTMNDDSVNDTAISDDSVAGNATDTISVSTININSISIDTTSINNTQKSKNFILSSACSSKEDFASNPLCLDSLLSKTQCPVPATATIEQQQHIWLMPLLAIAGTHTLHDMAGEHENSWKCRITANGMTCSPVTRGLIEHKSFVKLWLSDIAESLQKIV